eukprot:CAMPEP_0172497228 /NCGR_PEP_ID=MMETSP1066-20121228/96904_1 /TAXON_ID=671091 /ORGANISM="Coscinodiscus wailesii, Strain CCMP2513" /LENGTH=547 /DNA_ID=CAMNT_0013269875 /DNA_START=144 /DNA_END=1787 /DNA_ORIENTATION=-
MSSSSYIGPVYQQTQEVADIHAAPRFGYSSDFAQIASSDTETQLGYTYGAIFISVLVIVVLLAWFFIVFLFKCLGQHQVGFLSGSRFVEPLRGAYRRPRRVRITVIICCSAIIVFSVLLVTKGVNNIYVYTSGIQDGTQELKEIVDGTVNVSNEMTEKMSEAVTLRNQLVAADFLNVCPNVTALDGESVLSSLIAAETYAEDTAAFASESVKAQTNVDNFSTFLSNYVTWQWWQAIPIIAFMVCSSIFIVGTALAWAEISCGFFQCMQSWIVLPIFTILTLASWIAAAVFALGMVGNADMCSGGKAPGSPDATVVSLMNELQMDPYSLVYGSVEYIVEGCRAETPFLFVSNYQSAVSIAASTTQTYVNTLDNLGTEYLQQNCAGDVTSIQGTLQLLETNLSEQSKNTLEAISLTDCQPLNEIYVQAAHDATCDYSVTALIWIFASLMVLAVCGLTVITLRAAWLHIKRHDVGGADVSQVIGEKHQQARNQPQIEMLEMNGSTHSTTSVDELGMTPQSSTEMWERIPPAVIVDDVPPLLKGMSSERAK